MKKCNLIQNQPLPYQSFKEPLNPRTYTQNYTPHYDTRGDPLQIGGRGGIHPDPEIRASFSSENKGGPGPLGPSPEFLICCGIWKRFCLHWKAFDLLNNMRYILWMVALLEACDVTNNGRHLDRHLGFYQELEIRLKQREMVIAWHE